jgi:hypothetical protein
MRVSIQISNGQTKELPRFTRRSLELFLIVAITRPVILQPAHRFQKLSNCLLTLRELSQISLLFLVS